MLWGQRYMGQDAGVRNTRPPDAGGGLKAGHRYPGDLTGALKDGMPAAAAGDENMCGAGRQFYAELEALFPGEL